MDLEILLDASVAILNESHSAYAIAGGLASNLWVSKDRMRPTYDIDIACGVKARDAAETVAQALEKQGHTVVRTGTLPFRRAVIERLWIEGITLDFVMPRNVEFVNSAFARLQKGTSRYRTMTVLSPEDLFLYKALAKRERDIPPMCDLAEASEFDRKYVESWARKLGVWSFAKRALKREEV